MGYASGQAKRIWNWAAAVTLTAVIVPALAVALWLAAANFLLEEALGQLDVPKAKRAVRMGADIRLTVRGGVTVLQLAAISGDGALVEEALRRGADVNSADSRGGTPLMGAACGHPATVELLLHHGARVNAVDRNGNCALSNAAIMGDEQSVSILLRHGARVDLANTKGETPLDWARRHRRWRVLRILQRAKQQRRRNRQVESRCKWT